MLQDPKYPSIPGTVNLNEVVDPSKLEDWEYEEPKKIGDIVLNPQPTDSPNDSLNVSELVSMFLGGILIHIQWSMATKMTILLIFALNSGVTVSLGPMVTTGFDEIASAFKVTTDQISFNNIGVMTLTTGGETFFTAAAAATETWLHRHL